MWFLLILSLTILSSCGTRQEVILSESEPLERIKPIESMQNCADVLSDLPIDFPGRTVEDAIELLVDNRIIDSTFYFECKRKQEDLTRWINDE